MLIWTGNTVSATDTPGTISSSLCYRLKTAVLPSILPWKQMGLRPIIGSTGRTQTGTSGTSYTEKLRTILKSASIPASYRQPDMSQKTLWRKQSQRIISFSGCDDHMIKRRTACWCCPLFLCSMKDLSVKRALGWFVEQSTSGVVCQQVGTNYPRGRVFSTKIRFTILLLKALLSLCHTSCGKRSPFCLPSSFRMISAFL